MVTDVSLGSSVTLNRGDWLAIGCDNTTATFIGLNGGGDGTVAAGVMGVVAAFPAGASPTITYGNNRIIELIGVP